MTIAAKGGVKDRERHGADDIQVLSILVDKAKLNEQMLPGKGH
ncbi:MAG: hypothetical protein P8N76_03305 [Pirellulaceae bacterium]|nr:hypothetical protein [Pirellulaceae bacterium]